MRKLVTHANIVLPDRTQFDCACGFTDGVIDYIGTDTDQYADEIIHGNGCWLLPGFIDIHCHGGNGFDFMDASVEEMLEIARFHLKHGTTTLLATTMTGAWDEIHGALSNLAKLIESGNSLTIHGVHMEGPWFNPSQCGAQDPSCMDLPSEEKLRALLKAYPFIERISAAPELPGAMEIGDVGQKMGLIMSAAHTDADFDTMELAAEHGYTVMTHLYSGMKLTERINLYRVAGAVEAGLYDDRLYVELIADGKHLPVSLLKFVHKCKGSDKICLITDATRGAGLPDGTETRIRKNVEGTEIVIDDGVAKLVDRTAFAGSVATTDRLLRVMYRDAGFDMIEISRMMSDVPAKIMRYTDRGTIEVGKRADLVLLDSELRVKTVFLRGEAHEG